MAGLGVFIALGASSKDLEMGPDREGVALAQVRQLSAIYHPTYSFTSTYAQKYVSLRSGKCAGFTLEF